MSLPPIPVEALAVVAEGANEVQGAANGFGLLIDCTIRVNGDDKIPDLILRYSLADMGWAVEVVPKEATKE